MFKIVSKKYLAGLQRNMDEWQKLYDRAVENRREFVDENSRLRKQLDGKDAFISELRGKLEQISVIAGGWSEKSVWDDDVIFRAADGKFHAKE